MALALSCSFALSSVDILIGTISFIYSALVVRILLYKQCEFILYFSCT